MEKIENDSVKEGEVQSPPVKSKRFNTLKDLILYLQVSRPKVFKVETVQTSNGLGYVISVKPSA